MNDVTQKVTQTNSKNQINAEGFNAGLKLNILPSNGV